MTTKHRTCPPRIAAATVVLTLFGSGCGSFEGNEQFFSNLIEPLVAPTPLKAAQDLWNVYDPDKPRRAVALISASPFGGEQTYVSAYRLLITDRDATVRAACTKALGAHGSVEDAQLIAPLVRQKREEAAFVRWEAAKSLQRIHNPIVIDALMGALKDDDDADVRMAAAEALGQYARPVVFDALVGALADVNFGVAVAARRSLVTLTGQDLGHDSAPWMSWANQHRPALFIGRRPYAYQPYVRPDGWLDKIQFWKEKKQDGPQPPVGMEASGTHVSAPTG